MQVTQFLSRGTEPAGNLDRIVQKIRSLDPTAEDELYCTISKGLRIYLRKLGCIENMEDILHDVFMVLLEAIRKNKLRHPDALIGFVRTVARRKVAAYVRFRRSEESELPDVVAPGLPPDDAAYAHEKTAIMETVLDQLGPKQREILIRFYERGERWEDICQEMGLTETQFRLLKWRAKARFAELGRQYLAARR